MLGAAAHPLLGHPVSVGLSPLGHQEVGWPCPSSVSSQVACPGPCCQTQAQQARALAEPRMPAQCGWGWPQPSSPGGEALGRQAGHSGGGRDPLLPSQHPLLGGPLLGSS